MRRVCYSEYHVGDRFMGEKEPIADKSETHGLCRKCLKMELEQIEKEEKLWETKTRSSAR